MSLDLTIVAEDRPDALNLPEDGDDLDTAQVRAFTQILGDKAEAHRDALTGYVARSDDFSVAAGGSLTSFSVTVPALGRLFSLDSLGVGRVGIAGVDTIGVSKVEGAPGTLGAVARWWYVYAFLTTSGVVDYAISTTAPAASRAFKGSDTTRVYLGCFPTLASGAPIPLQKVAGRVLYRRSALGSAELRVINLGAAAGTSTVSLTPLVPPHARIVTMQLDLTGGSGDADLSLFYPGDTASHSLRCLAQAGKSNSIMGDVMVNASQQIDRTLSGSGSPAAEGHVLGFYE